VERTQAERERLELDFWRTADEERAGARSLVNLVVKLGEAHWLLAGLDRFRDDFQSARSILELGAGQGWASCVVKRMFPHAEVTASDISAEALVAVESWAGVLGARPDHTVACRSAEIPVEDGSVDVVFCFQAAHHFGDQRRTLSEVARVLTQRGTCLYLHEPSSRRYIRGLARRRLKRKRADVSEDVLDYKELETIGRDLGFDVTVQFDPSPINRAPLETVYYIALGAVPPLQRLLPCTADYRFRKPA
jgi:SAM-dependent methyltransferase